MVNITKAILDRRSVRVFRSFSLSYEEIRELIKAACYAPAGGNDPTWEVIVVQDDVIKDEITKVSLNQEFIRYSSVVFVFLGGRTVNVAAAIQNLLLAAHHMGLEGCWIGAFDKREVAKILKVPPEVPIHAIVAVGKPEEIPTNPGKRFPEEVMHFERYGNRKIDLSLLKKIVKQADDKLEEFKTLRENVKSNYGEESYYMYRLEEKYAAFVFRPLLKRVIRILEELGVYRKLCERLKEAVKEYERGRGELLRKTLNINSREVVLWERQYSNDAFPELIREVVKAVLKCDTS